MQDPTEFRKRFQLYKEGKMPYENGLPKYAEGTPSYDSTVEFLKKHEGFKDTTYLDGNGIPTIGYGFTDSSLVKKGTISRAEADRRLKQEVAARESVLSKMKNWDKLSEDSKTALRSYYYNYPAGFKSTTRFMKAWNAGNYEEAIRQVDAGMNDKNNPGLRKRRLEEQALLKADPFLRPVQTVQPTPIVNQSVSTAVRPIIKEEQTVPAYDPTISPYVSGKPMLKFRPRVQLPNLIEVMEDSEWEAPFQLTPRGYKNGKLPEYKDGTRYLWDDQKGEWDRITDSDVANAMAQWAFTPTTTRAKFNYENTPNPVKPLSKNAVVKQDDDLWTRQQVEKANNTRTWRSDVADVLHNIGEGTMLASTFAAPEIEPLVYPTYQMAKGSIQQAIKQHAAPYLVSALMRPKPQYITPVINRFRNQEWSNFLQTVNGDNYYRIARDASALNPKEKYFISHTTPWEEFTRFGENNNGAGRLYEFPTKTFGRLNSTDYKGVKSVHDVTEMGKRHLLYGNTASGPRGQVRLLSDNDAETIGVDPFVTGLTERPLGQKGMYDARPIYDDIYMGNQTTIKGRRFNEAVVNAPHSEYYTTEGGVQRVLHTSDNPLHNYGITPDWKNPKNNALSVEQQDAMLGEYVGKGAERQVFDDRRFPVGRRVIKIGGGVNGEEKIYNFDQLRDAVEYAMEINKLPNVPPMSYEGFTSEGGQLIPWFSQEKVLPMKKIADPFQTFSKKPILPNGKTASNKLSAIRRIDSDKIFSPIGYKPVLNMPARYRVDGYPYTIGDLGQKNIGFDVFGNLKIFDPMIDL